MAAYLVVPPAQTVASIRLSTLLLGLGLAVAFGAAGIAAIHWAKTLMPDRELVEERHPQRSDAETREQAAQVIERRRRGQPASAGAGSSRARWSPPWRWPRSASRSR